MPTLSSPKPSPSSEWSILTVPWARSGTHLPEPGCRHTSLFLSFLQTLLTPSLSGLCVKSQFPLPWKCSRSTFSCCSSSSSLSSRPAAFSDLQIWSNLPIEPSTTWDLCLRSFYTFVVLHLLGWLFNICLLSGAYAPGRGGAGLRCQGLALRRPSRNENWTVRWGWT